MLHFAVKRCRKRRGAGPAAARRSGASAASIPDAADRGGHPPQPLGFDGQIPRVLIESKFWAGLTDQQPVAYLQALAASSKPTALLMLVPMQRRETIWREINRRLRTADIEVAESTRRPGVYRQATTSTGPIIAVVTWRSVLYAMETAIDAASRTAADVDQLRALCAAEDEAAFTPLSDELMTDLRLTRLVADLRRVIQLAVDQCCASGHLSVDGLRTGMSWMRMRRYVRYDTDKAPGAWIGIDFSLWQQHGTSPVWLAFADTEFGQAQSVESRVRAFAGPRGLHVTYTENTLFMALPLATGAEEAAVVADLCDTLRSLHGALTSGDSA